MFCCHRLPERQPQNFALITHAGQACSWAWALQDRVYLIRREWGAFLSHSAFFQTRSCSGKRRRVSMARTRRSTIVFCAGAGWASSTIFVPNWQKQRGWPGDDRCEPPQGASNRRQFAQKRALSRCIGRTKGGLNSKTMPFATATAGPWP